MVNNQVHNLDFSEFFFDCLVFGIKISVCMIDFFKVRANSGSTVLVV